MEEAYLLNSELAQRICFCISDRASGRVLRVSRQEAGAEGGVRNLYRALLTENGRRLLSYAATDAHFLSDDYSDYENFEELLYLLPSLVGSGYYSFVRLFLEDLLGLRTPPTPTDAYALWHTSLPLLEGGTFDRLSEPFSDKRVVDLTPWVFPTADALHEYDTVDDFISAFRQATEGAALFQFDPSALSFVSPDPYHAERGFFTIREGKGNDAYLSSQLLRITGEICKEREAALILSGEIPFDEFKRLFTYLTRVSRMPNVYCAIPLDDGTGLRSRLEGLEASGLLSTFRGLIPIGLSVGGAATIKESVKYLAAHYPIGRLCFIAEGRTAAEARMEYELLLRLLSELLAASVEIGEISEADAVTVGTEILTSAVLL